MFGLGMGEIVIIAVVALLFIGPDKLPGAAKSIGKGIRDLRKQSRDLQDTIEKDTEFGAAVRDLKSALRGDDYTPPAPAPNVGSDAAVAAAVAADKPPEDIDPAAEAVAAESAGGEEPEAGPESTPEGELIRGAPGAVSRGSDEDEEEVG